MRALRLLVVLGLVATAVGLAPGCRGATQMTIDVRAINASCSELRGTSITIGIEPKDTEARVAQGFVNASTETCTPETGEIGTLVVTPSDARRGAVVVIVAYGNTTDPSKCAPPEYKGCIVARRSFAFVDHEGLRLPITVSPDCLDVPCDAFSTCRHGQCFSNEVSCPDGTCGEPGELGDGGTGPGTVPPTPPGVPTEPFCDGTILHCHPGGDPAGDVACGSTSQACCSRGGLAQCGAPSTCAGQTRYCCADSDCASGRCVRPNRVNGGAPLDASADDSGAVDGGSPPDAAALDAGSGTDAGYVDAGSATDAAAVDAGSGTDADGGADSGTSAAGSGVGMCE